MERNVPCLARSRAGRDKGTLYLVLDRTRFMTIPIHIQYLKGSYGTVDLGATMALILMSIIPVIAFYLACQKHIIKGVAAGAIKG